MSSVQLGLSPRRLAPRFGRRSRNYLTVFAWALAAVLPLVGLVSLLMRHQLDPDWSNHKAHFTTFLTVGTGVFLLSYLAYDGAKRRGDARVLLISLTFLATGGFLGLHALGTTGVLFTTEHAGFKIANPVGLVLAALFAGASAFVDLRPSFAPFVVRHRVALRRAVIGAMVVWVVWTLADLPPLSEPSSEGGTHSALTALAALGFVVYAVSAARYLYVYRGNLSLLSASVIACFVLLAEAMVGVALTGERAWHASWWWWHGLIVTAYALVGYAAHREWRDDRFRGLYLATTRERTQPVSVLFSDLAGFTAFAERSTPGEVATMLNTYYAIAAPLISRRFGGEVEKFMGDGLMATFNSRGDQPDHAARAAQAALQLQHELSALVDANPGWPRARIGVNSGDAVVREMGGHGYVGYEVVGDTVNTGSRLEGQAPVGGVLIGAETRRGLPAGADVEAVPALRVKGKERAVDAFVLHALPAAA